MNFVMVEPGLHVASVDTAYLPHAQARLQLRAALRELVGSRLGINPDYVTIRSVPGCAPQLALDGHLSAQGVSLTYAGQFAYAAFHTRGPVGIDIVQVQDVADMDKIALQFLGPEVCAMLAIVSPARRADLFAHAWARREAHLKCLGLSPGDFKPLPGNCRVHPLAVPKGYAGVLVTKPLGR